MKKQTTVIRILGLLLAAGIFFGSGFPFHSECLYAAPKPETKLEPAGALQIVNINQAGSEELQTVSGIGPAIAERIIQYRQEHGPFKQADELMNVQGIGGAKLQKIKDQITV